MIRSDSFYQFAYYRYRYLHYMFYFDCKCCLRMVWCCFRYINNNIRPELKIVTSFIHFGIDLILLDWFGFAATEWVWLCDLHENNWSEYQPKYFLQVTSMSVEGVNKRYGGRVGVKKGLQEIFKYWQGFDWIKRTEWRVVFNSHVLNIFPTIILGFIFNLPQIILIFSS